MQWKELLAWAAAGEDDHAAELYFYFLGDKKIFDGRGNVESRHLGGGLLEERAGVADWADVWDSGGMRDIRPDEFEPCNPNRWIGAFGLEWCTWLSHLRH